MHKMFYRKVLFAKAGEVSFVFLKTEAKAVDLAYDIFPLFNRIKCRLEICENIGDSTFL